MARLVALVICALLVAPLAAATPPRTSVLLRLASQRSGLKIRRPVRVASEPTKRFDAHMQRAVDREYPPSVQRLDDAIYLGLGLLPAEHTIRSTLVSTTAQSRAYYDPAARVLRVRRRPAPKSNELIHQLVRALVDQNFGLRRIAGLRARDRDAAFAASAVVDGVAAAASRIRALPPQGSPLTRFLAVEQSGGLEFGRRLISELRYLGGNAAVATALRKFPRTTEDILHVDKFLEREPALPVLPAVAIADLRLTASETFGELDVLALLRAFDVANADVVADGWGGARVALYSSARGNQAVALILRWDTNDDAAEWREAVPHYVAAAFPNVQERLCPVVDHCWLAGDRELATITRGNSSVFASGYEAEVIAAALGT